ncbi:LTA synthase family protein [uncultured Draconibacterium sp.]|uniref:LTA synthase family protein n=1 Tax=uncultured Draconibacterium sp. TaxID=1573823 RepID=UPI0032178751
MGNFKNSKYFIVRSLRRFLSLSIVLGLILLSIRVYEIIYIANISNYPVGSFLNIVLGLKFDLLLILRISAILLVPFLLLSFFSQKSAKVFFVSISLFLVLGYVLLLQYFSTALIPLGADLFGYSIQEIKFTIETSGEFRIFPVLIGIAYVVYVLRVFKKHVYFKLKPLTMALLVLGMFVSFLPLRFLQVNPSHYENEFSMFVAENKLGFFSESVVNSLLKKEVSNDQPFTFKEHVVTAEGNPFVYLDSEYPFLHKETTPDILSNYFDLGETPPNIVFLLTESLGRAYSGENAYLGSYTPFLDSIAQHSLYWENCLSTSGRTFQVLPSILASLPFGKHGFNEMGEAMPDHLSIITILKKEAGYKSSFIYGSEAEFDNMDVFLERQGIDQIIDTRSFDDTYTKLPGNESGFTWGYGDKDIFRRYIQKLSAEVDSASANLDVLLTLAMHPPFNVPNQEYYNNKFEKYLEELKITDKQKEYNRSYVKQFASILYFDESLRYFFNEIKKLPSFTNTIFIITGDHRMPEIPISTQIDRFHVPLIVYSPMLKKAEKFSSVVTHFDITPSLLAMLDGKGYISRPPAASWLGHGLDNSVEYRCLNSYALMRNKNELLDLVEGENFLANNSVYDLYPNLYIEPIRNSDLQSELKAELNNFIRKNNFACENNRLIPDSLKLWMKQPF